MIWLIRHGETEWSLSGAHTGLTDIPLTARGEEKAAQIRHKLEGRQFQMVLTSPLQRARRTAALAGIANAEIDPNLIEWDYGKYEGRKTADIRMERPGWFIFTDGVPGGETIDQVAARADKVIERVLAVKGDVALFAHGHILRILAARWLCLEPQAGRLFALDTGGISKLGFEHEDRVITRWNI